MDIKVFSNFVVVAREKSFSKAADKLHISQSAISRQIKLLEEELGKQLFVRRPFSISLTDEGKEFLDIVLQIYSFAEKPLIGFATKAIDVSGTIYFDVPETFQVRFLAKQIRAFREKYPKMKYSITSSDHSQRLKSLDDGSIDFAVLLEKPNSDKYEYIKFPDQDELIFLTTKSHGLAGKENIKPKDLINTPVFANELIWKRYIRKWAGDDFENFSLEGYLLLPYNLYAFVKEGLGSMITINNRLNINDSDIVIKQFRPEIKINSYIVWRKQMNMSRVACMFAEYVREQSQCK
ncbi:MAG: LysR family transcriptional regulator [Lachnospiraceae bacterium]|nr:LysR family transcriptional regulator [Lachnospiraceae bacterium]